MRTFFKNYFIPILLLSSSALVAVAPYYSIRSQAENAARDLAGAGWVTQIHDCHETELYGNFSIVAEYTKSFHPYYIGKTLFGCCGSNCYYQNNCCGTNCGPCGPCGNNCCDDQITTIRISGSGVENRGSCDWLADYFGLPTDFKSCVTFEPRIQNFILDFNLFVGLECCPGLYFRFGFPVVHTKWDLNMCECVENRGENNHWAGYFNKTYNNTGSGYYGISRENLVSNFTSFISGCGTINSNDIVFNTLNYARMCPCDQKETALADVNAMLGWDFWCCDDYHFGVNVRASAPAGNRPNAHYLFEPIVGNGHHWAVGAGISGHWNFYKECDECNYWGVYVDANFTHLFKARQCRTFDLYCKPLSRYMLATYFGRPVEELKAGEDEASAATPIKQFKDVYTPVANLTTFPVDVSVDLQADVAVKFQHVRGNWGFDLGYNFWNRGCENIAFVCECQCPFEENTWALKGDAFMYGFKVQPVTDLIAAPLNPGVALSATQSKATICRGTNNRPDGDLSANLEWYQNPGVDYRQLAQFTSVPPQFEGLRTVTPEARQAADFKKVYTSLEPQFISFCDIDCNAARTRAMSHKIFGSIDYTWRNRECCDTQCCGDWIPWLGLGFEVEIGHHLFDDGCDACCQPCSGNEYACGTGCCFPCDKCCNDNCCCQFIPLSQWGIWLKGGVAF